MLRSIPRQLRELLAEDDPALGRLFPPAYTDDPDRNEEYERLMRGDLTAERLRSVETLERTIDADRVDAEQLGAWLGAINDARLVLGTKLDVTEDSFEQPALEDGPHGAALTLYGYLGWLEEQVVEALASDLE